MVNAWKSGYGNILLDDVTEIWPIPLRESVN